MTKKALDANKLLCDNKLYWIEDQLLILYAGQLVLASWTIGDLTVILNNCLKSIHTGPQIRFLESQECKRFFWGIDLPKYCNIFI